MNVRVEHCWNGKADGLYFRLTMPGGGRERINSERWTRRVATEALDLAEKVYGLCRRNVRFIHR